MVRPKVILLFSFIAFLEVSAHLIAASDPPPRFVWSGITNRIAADEPWPITIEAVDSSGTRASNYSAIVTLGVFQKTNIPPALVITEISASPKRVELSNPTTNQVDIDGWQLMLVDRRSATSWVSFAFTNVIVPPKGVFTVEESFPRSSAYPKFYWTGLVDWGFSSPFGAVIRNSAGELVDVVFTSAIQPSALVLDVVPDHWRGSGVNSFGGRVRRTGPHDSNSPSDFTSSGISNMGQYNPDLAYPLQTWIRPETVSPGEIQLTNGIWSGEIVVPWATYVVLTAEDGNGSRGRSPLFHALPNPPLTLNLPSSALEGSQTLTGRVHLPSVASNDTTVLLQAGSPLLEVESSVIIPAGSTNASFFINVSDDDLLNGSREAIVIANASGFYRATASIQINDNESTALFFSVPAQISEGQTNSVTLAAASAPDVDVSVHLAAVPQGLLLLPANIVLRAGETNAQFALAAPEDDILDSNTVVTITATVANWTNAVVEVLRLDTDPRVLVLDVPAVLWEGSGTRSNAGSIRLNGRVRENTEFVLESGSPLLEVPASVTIPAGRSNATFHISVGDDLFAEGRMPVELQAQSPGFGSVRQSISVEDNDPVEIRFGPIKSPQFVGHEFPVVFTAVNFDGTLLTNPIPNLALSALLGGAELPGAFATVTQAQGGYQVGVKIFTNALATVITANVEGRTNRWESAPFNVFALSVTNLSFAALDLAWDTNRHLLYATVPEQSTNYSTQLVAIDPASGQVIKSLPIGPMRYFETSTSFRDGRVALSDDQSTLYVAYDLGQRVKRVDLNAWSSTLDFVITNEFISQMAVADMCVVPGNPSLLAVLETRVTSTSPWQLALYENGVRVAGGTRDFISNIAPGFAPGELFGFSSSFFEKTSKLITYSAQPNSLTTVTSTNTIALGYSDYIKPSGGKLFGNRGAVFDPLTRVLGFFDVLPTLVDPDTSKHRAFFLGYTNLLAFDTETFLQAADLPLPALTGRALGLESLGNQVAIGTTDSLLLVSSDLIDRSQTTDLGINLEKPATNAVAGQPYSYSVTVTNKSDILAADVRLVMTVATNRLALPGPMIPGNAGLIYHTVLLGNLAPGAQTNLTVTATPLSGGFFPLTFAVSSGSPESSYADNRSEVFVSVGIPPLPPDGHARATLNVADVAYSPVTARLYLSLAADRELPSGAVAIVEPSTLDVEHLLFVGERPGKLTVSADGKYLYVLLKEGSEIARSNLQDGNTAPLRFSPAATDRRFRAIAASPAAGDSVAVASATTNQFDEKWELAIYDSGVSRPLVGLPYFAFRKDVLLFSDAGTLLHAFDAEAQNWERYKVESGGLSFLETDRPSFAFRAAPISAALREPHIFLPTGSILHTGGDIVGRLQGDLEDDAYHDAQILYHSRADLIVVSRNLGANIALHFYDPTTRSVLVKTNLPWLSGRIGSFVRWGQDGFALVRETGELHVMRTSILPTAGPAETSVALGIDEQVGAGEVFTIRLSLTNRSSTPVENARVSLSVPSELAYVSINPLSMPVQRIDESLLIEVGTLPPSALRSIYLTVRCSAVGNFQVAARLFSSSPEINLTDNVARAGFETRIKPPTFTQFNLKVGEKSRFRVHEARNEIWAIQKETNLISINLTTGTIQTNASLISPASLLEITPSGRYLYVGGYYSPLVRFDLENDLQALTIPIDRLNALVPLPENETSILVSHVTESFAPSLQIWDDATVRSNILYSSPLYGLAVAAPETVYGSGSAPLWEITYDQDGVQTATERIPQYRSFTRELQFINDLVYTSTGELLDPATNAIIREIAPTGFVIGFADDTTGRYFGAMRAQNHFTVTAYEIPSFTSRNSVILPEVLGHPRQIARWGPNGLVFSTSVGELWIVRSSVVPFEAPDLDDDGMPDTWEDLHGLLPTVSDADADPDGDGASNGSEYRAGTDPNDPASCLKLRLEFNSNSEAPTLSVQTVPGRRYQLEGSDTLSTGWSSVSVPFYGSAAPLALHLAQQNSSIRFYRMRELN